MNKTTITITFSESVENHVGMEKIGTSAEEGFNLSELVHACGALKKMGSSCEIYDLGVLLTDEEKDNTYTPAYILVARNATNTLLKDIGKTSEDMLKEELSYEWDTTIFSRKHTSKGRSGVVNKVARHNVCYAEKSQVPDIVNGKGTVVSFNDLPILGHIRKMLPKLLGKNAKNLLAEGNKYYDVSKCGIGFHGDTERRKIIGLRVGSSMNLHYQWYKKFKPVGNRFEVILNSGDLYVMSDKAGGQDWKKSSTLTLRHAAGCVKYTNPKKLALVFPDIDIQAKIPFGSDMVKNVQEFCKNINMINLIPLLPDNIVFLYELCKLCKKLKKTCKGDKKIIDKILKLYEDNNYNRKTMFGYHSRL